MDTFHSMIVALYLPTMEDVKKFEQINHKIGDAVNGININPSFRTMEETVKFTEIFQELKK